MKLRRRFLKSMLAALLAIAVDLSIAAPQAHAAEPETMTKTQAFMESDGKDSVTWPEVIRNESGTWKLVEVSEPETDPNWTRPSELKSITKSMIVDAARVQNADSLFDNEISYDEPGWTGTLTKAGVDLSPEYEVCTRQVDKLVTLTGLATNDVTQIPKTKEFEVSTAESLNSTGPATLALSDVAWLVTKTNEQGIPLEYSASCNYRGVEEYLTIPAYTLTCTWTGEAQQADTQMISTAVYELESSFPWFAVAAIAVAGVCAALAVYVRTRMPGAPQHPQEA